MPEVVKAARDELRKGADHIKIMVSGGVASQLAGRGEEQHTAGETTDFEVAGDHKTIAGVVAFAAEDGDGAVDAQLLKHVDAAGRACRERTLHITVAGPMTDADDFDVAGHPHGGERRRSDRFSKGRGADNDDVHAAARQGLDCFLGV